MPRSAAPSAAPPGSPPDDDSKAGITLILNRALAGDAASRERVYALLYAELLRLARSHLSGSGALSLNPSALVHEAYLRMLAREATPMRDRRAFFAYASSVMRSVLIDHVRAGAAEKRGGLFTPVTLTTGVLNSVAAEEDFSRLNDALDALRGVDERSFRVVEMRYFAGMTEEDIAGELDVSVPTVKRDWRKARAFLFEQLR
ncbi:MAG TPA: ECF-type sigma factor [Caldimonas sp.]|jgi:RNA polymerase sigma factor (TIGR02999 family)|nr:ECF-type sigma factor [Caldimonas sp.]